jgi:hypothetical protein
MVDELAIPSRTEESDKFRQVLVAYGGPAFLRRAAEVTAAYDHLLHLCRRHRHERLAMVRLRLAQLQALDGTWNTVRPLLADESQLQALIRLFHELAPQLRCELSPASAVPVLRQALAKVNESIAYFNHRWVSYLRSVKLDDINKLRDGYNRFYVLEKECAVGSGALARRGFRPLEMLRSEDLLVTLPELPQIRLSEEGGR